MPDRARVRDEVARCLGFFESHGAVRVETDILQPADVLLDLYGEDIRARAFVTHDPVRGEAMLRPDFTVPVLRMHMERPAGEARYTYAGKIFRAQEAETHRPPEYEQVGFEIIDSATPVAAEAEVFALLAELLAPLGLRMATGDVGLLIAAVRGLDTTERRKAALLRHLWRPRRFRALLDRFSGRAPMPEGRKELLAMADPMAGAQPLIGLRGADEIAARIEALREDAAAAPIPGREVDLLDDILSLRETAPNVLAHLRDIAVDLPAIMPALERMEERLAVLSDHGIDPARLDFEGSYGRTSLEYYDGFVFGFYAAQRPDLPPVATGGRYDALTKALGQGRQAVAVGGVVRPELVALLTETA